MLRALITGTSRGIGRALCLELADRGVELLLLGRSSADQTETEEMLASKGAAFAAYYCDFKDRKALDAALVEALHSGPVPDAIVHNAAMIERSEVRQMSDRLWDEQI